MTATVEHHVPDERAELEQALTNLCHRAKREVPKVGSTNYPTPWDKRHDAINGVLDDRERAGCV